MEPFGCFGPGELCWLPRTILQVHTHSEESREQVDPQTPRSLPRDFQIAATCCFSLEEAAQEELEKKEKEEKPSMVFWFRLG